MKVLVIILLTVISGIGDAYGFTHAAKMWVGGILKLSSLLNSAQGFLLGITSYWLSVKFMQDVGILSAEIQSLIWFTVTILGVVLLNGEFIHWRMIDKIVAGSVLVGMSWLLVRIRG